MGAANADRHTQKLGRQQKRDAAQTDIPQNWATGKNVMQHGQIYPKTGPSAKCDAAQTDIFFYHCNFKK